MMKKGFSQLLKDLPGIEKKLHSLEELILANLVMISEIPSPTFREENRREFLINRFTEFGLHNCSTDEVGNALGILPGQRGGDRIILVVAHLDTVFDETVDHTVAVQPNKVTGPSVADNSLGLASIASLPSIFEHLQIKMDSDLILMGSSRSLGKGNVEGLRFFIDHTDLPVSAGVCVEGVQLGRISYSSIGMARCEIVCKLPDSYDWTRFGLTGSIVTVNEIINRILEIPLPTRPRTSIVLGNIEGGTDFNTVARETVLRFEIRSESDVMVQQLTRDITNIAAEVESHSGAEVTFENIAQRSPGGITFAHPMSSQSREIMRTLDIQPRITPSTSELSAFIDHTIPAVTLGMTFGENFNQKDESIEIEPVFSGLAQLVGLILAIDRGYCDEHQ
jgi:di/tripeptidase